MNAISEYKRKEQKSTNEISGIYCILNTINDKRYIGQTYDLRYRWNIHKSDLNCERHHNNHLQSAWEKYGADIFTYTILEECSLNIINEREIYWINYYDAITAETIGLESVLSIDGVEKFGNGYFFMLQDEPIDANNPQHIEKQKKVTKLLGL